MKINLEEGTITFQVKKDKINWKDNKEYKLFNYSNEIGNIMITKTDKNFLEFSHQFGKIKTIVKANTTNFVDKDHHIVAVWSIRDGKIALYIDGKEVATKRMEF